MSQIINGADFSAAVSIAIQNGSIDQLGALAAVSKQVNQVVGQLREHILLGLQQIPEIQMICEFSDNFRESRTVKQKLNLIQKIFQGKGFAPTDQLPKFEEMARGRMDNLLLFATQLDKGLFSAITGGEALDRVSTDCVARCASRAVYLRRIGIALELIQRRDFDLSSVITEVENAEDLEAILELTHQLGRTYSTAYDHFADSPSAIMSRHETLPGLQSVLNNAIYRCRHPKFMEVLLRYANPSLEILLHARDWARLGQVCMAARAQFPGHDFRSSNMLLHREDGRDGERERIYQAVPDRFRYGQYDIRGFASDPYNRRAAFIGMLNRAIDSCPKTRSEAALIQPMSEDLREALREVPAPPRVENSFARLLGLGSEEERTCFLAFLVFTLFFALNAYVVLQR